jgi:hypothetical protein
MYFVDIPFKLHESSTLRVDIKPKLTLDISQAYIAFRDLYVIIDKVIFDDFNKSYLINL